LAPYEVKGSKTLHKSKLNPRGDGPFQILKKIKDNVYQLDLHSEYGVHSTFNVFDLIPFCRIYG